MNFYEVLGVDEDADSGEIKRAFRDRARRYHPDVNDHPRASEQFTVLTKARDVLTDAEERTAYDRLGHADYVEERLDGDLPDPEMSARPGEDTSGTRTTATSTGSESTARTGAAASGSTSGSSTDTSSTGRTDSDTDPPSADDGAAGTSGRDGRDSTGDPVGGGSSESDPGSASASGSTAGGAPSDAGAATASSGGGKATSTPPTPGADGETGGATGGHSDASTGPTPTGARTWQVVRERASEHLTASRRWVGVVGAAGTYFAGLAGYLEANRAGVDAMVAAVTSGDPARFAAALGTRRYGVPTVLAYTDRTGMFVGLAPSAGVLVLLGAVLLPLTMAAAVVGLRRRTTWRPSWLHAVGTLGPALSVGLVLAGANYPGTVPVSELPLLVDLLVVGAIPAVVVASFLLNRLVVVLPLRRREDVDSG